MLTPSERNVKYFAIGNAAENQLNDNQCEKDALQTYTGRTEDVIVQLEQKNTRPQKVSIRVITNKVGFGKTLRRSNW